MMRMQFARAERSTPVDEGVALAMTIGIMLVGFVILAIIAVVTVANVNGTVKTRAEMSAYASADAGIDMAVNALADEAHDTMGDACAFEVPASATVNDDSVAIAQQYTVTRSGTSQVLPVGTCPLATDETQRVRLTATATTPGVAADGGPLARTVVAELIPVPPQIGLDKAIFSNASVNLVSGTVLEQSEGATEPDAHVYSNGNVTCSSNTVAGGTVYAAQGNVSLGSNCTIANDMWASGWVHIGNGATVLGDVWAAGNTLAASGYAITLSGNNTEVTGSLLTNGDVLLSGSKSLAGNIYSSAGSVWLDQVDVAGSIYAMGAIDFKQAGVGTDAIAATLAITGDNNNKTVIGRNARAGLTITGIKKVTGTTTPLSPLTGAWPDPAEPAFDFGDQDPGYPDAIDPPARENLPKITMNDEDLALWSAAGWTIERYTGVCTADQVDPLINTGLSVGAGRVLVFDGCSAPVGIITSDVTLSTSIALVSWTGFTNQNASNITGTSGDEPTLYMITPAQDGKNWSTTTDQPACPASSELYDIRVGAFKFHDARVFAYTPCDFDYKTSVNNASDPWEGQIYAGSAFPGSGAFKLKMAQTDVPSAVSETPDLTQPANLTVVSRYDEHG